MAQSPETGGARRGSWQALPPEPWKNGGGVTRTLAADTAEGAAPRWRLSVADITRDGPYSRFAGDDRVSVVLSGAGVVLRDAGVPQREGNAQILLPPGQPVAYAGDAAWHGTLVDGPVQVLNLFVRRGAARAWVRGVGQGPQAGRAGVAAGALAACGAARHLTLCVAHVAGGWHTPEGVTELAAGEFLLRPAACSGHPANPGGPRSAEGQAEDTYTPIRGASPPPPGLAAVLLDIFY
ncbi:HutD/Ves family protein [Achromobacter sp. NCFB-sbj8-Ac1-l]|uniref:HutD/Ves family protein n=1 Tax=unclassified Achromobacter TaxID=2626865 RepID=UPI004046FC3F